MHSPKSPVFLPLSLLHATVNGNGGEVLIAQKCVESLAATHALDKDDNLVELEGIEEVKKLAVLLFLRQLHVKLLEAVQRELGVRVNVHLHGVVHKLFADWANLVGEGGAEHHDLLLVGSGEENLLYVTAHV